MVLRVACWPMGFIPIAKGARQTFFWTELVGNFLQVVLIYFCVLHFGLSGTGIAFFVSYVFFGFLVYAIVRAMTGFRWSAANKQIGLGYGLLIGVVFIGGYVVPRPIMVVGGTGITLLAGIYSLKQLCILVPFERLPRLVQRTTMLLRLVPPQTQR